MSTLSDITTHSRAGNATMVDTDGVLKWAPHNLMQRSEDFGDAYWIKEAGGTGSAAVATSNAVVAPDGTTTASRVIIDVGAGTTSSDFSGFYTITVADGASLLNRTCKVWAKVATGTATVNFNIIGSPTASIDAALTTEWQLITTSGTATVAVSGLRMRARGDLTNGSMEVHLWGAHLYRSDLGGMVDNPDQPVGFETYVPTTSAAVYLPRTGNHIWDGSQWVKGYRHEEARTNLVTYSQDFTDASWIKTNGDAFTYTFATAPDGALTATRFNPIFEPDPGGAAKTFRVFAFVNSTIGDVVSFSVYVKPIVATSNLEGPTDVYLSLYADQSQGISYLNLNTLEITADADHTALVTDEGNGWYRFSISYTCASSDTENYHFIGFSNRPSFQATYDPYPDGNEDVYFWGAQVEIGSTPSSYIPTAGLAVERAADVMTIPIENIPYPEPVVIGPESITDGSFDNGLDDWLNVAFDAATLELGGARIERDGGVVNSAIAQVSVLQVGKVYRLNYDILDGNGSATSAVLLDGTNGITIGSVIGSYSLVFVADSTTFQARCFDGNFAVLDNISVREINPLAVSIAVEGYMTYADRGLDQESLLVSWLADADNRIQTRLDTNAGGTGRILFLQEALTITELIASPADTYAPGVNVPFSIASRHGSTFLNGAVDGTALTADTTPVVLPDLSVADMSLFSTGNYHITKFRMWGDTNGDIGDVGIAEASE